MFRIADFNIETKAKFDFNSKKCHEYLCDLNEVDLTVSVDKSDLDYEQAHSEIQCDSAYLGYIAIHRKIAGWLPLHNAFVLHSACFDVDGIGVAFAAHSGTGKTTHMRLWQRLLGDKMVVVNGDKPIVRFFDDEPQVPYAYGTPWNGKERLGCNMRTPLKHICFIERSETNFVEKIDKKDAINLIFNQVYMPKDPIAVINTLQLIDRLLSCCSLWKIHCNMEPETAEIAYNTIFNQKENV